LAGIALGRGGGYCCAGDFELKSEIYPLLQPGDQVSFDHPSLGRLFLPVLEVMGLDFIRMNIPGADDDIWDFHDERIGPPF